MPRIVDVLRNCKSIQELSQWTSGEVARFVDENNIPLAKVYFNYDIDTDEVLWFLDGNIIFDENGKFTELGEKLREFNKQIRAIAKYENDIRTHYTPNLNGDYT